MHLSVVIFGVTMIELSVSDSLPEGPPHLEDHTGYRVGFVSPPPVPEALDMPPRDL
jgi:hypothetical protein